VLYSYTLYQFSPRCAIRWDNRFPDLFLLSRAYDRSIYQFSVPLFNILRASSGASPCSCFFSSVSLQLFLLPFLAFLSSSAFERRVNALFVNWIALFVCTQFIMPELPLLSFQLCFFAGNTLVKKLLCLLCFSRPSPR